MSDDEDIAALIEKLNKIVPESQFADYRPIYSQNSPAPTVPTHEESAASAAIGVWLGW